MDFFNDDSVIPNVKFGAGFLVASKIGYMDIPHIHDGADNYFIFTGADLTNIFESEFEVDFFMGDSAQSMEVYNITKPSFIRVPAGVWHCPVYYKKVVRGLNNMLWYGGTSTGRVYPRTDGDGKSELFYEKDNWVRDCVKDPTKLCTWCGLCFDQTEEHVLEYVAPFYKNVSNTRKYKDCVMELKKDDHKLGGAVMSPRAVFKGVNDMPDTDRQFSFNIVTKPCKLGDDEPMSNGQVAEFLWFSGSDAVDPWGSFDTEIEVALGEDPDHMEIITFDKPGVIALPPKMWRGAIRFKRVGKPVCFMPWYPHSQERYKITRKTAADGRKFLAYDDESTIKEPTAGDELYLQIKR
jgi:hypothetical protein